MLVTKALSQDVMLLAFVPLPLVPKESPSRNENQLILMTYVLTKCHPQLLVDDSFIKKGKKTFITPTQV